MNSKFMQEALDIAFSQMGMTSPNPAVGAVVVKDDRIISTGGTCPAGLDHAEIVALKAACRLDGPDFCNSLEGAEIYVSLEPCSHYGKTPPCTEAIISAGIKRVHIPLLDPNPLVAGKGVQKLREAGVDVVVHHDAAPVAADLIRPFKKMILRKKSYVIHKCAMTLDGKIATSGGDSKWISSPYSRFVSHRLRQKVDAVIVGMNTFLNDNPSLTIRFDEFDEEIHSFFRKGTPGILGRENIFFKKLLASEEGIFPAPLRVLAGIPEKINGTSNFFADSNYLVFESPRRFDELQRKKANALEKLDPDRIRVAPSDDPVQLPSFILTELALSGIMFAMLEGGSLLAGSFFDAGEIDQFLYVKAPKIIGSGIAPIAAAERSLMSEAGMVHDISVAMTGPDVIVTGYREKYNFEMM